VNSSGQTLPHIPQLFESVVMSVQLPAHCTLGAAQALMLQTPDTQAKPVGHALPHAPQLLGSEVMSWHMPLPVQSAVPGAHTTPPLQIPITQPVPAGHTLPQPPQLFGSLFGSTQPMPPQLRNPPPQAG
jgi:hypothetical protein